MSIQSLFQNFYSNKQKLNDTEVAELKNSHILFIPGIFSKFIHLFIGNYFHPQIKFLESHGITNYSILWSTELSCEAMSEKIKVVADAHEKILVVTHSKGGIDFLTFLVNNPTYKSKLRGWLCMQAPIQGSPFADFLFSYKIIRYPLYVPVLLFGGECRALEQLTSKYRKKFMKENNEQIDNILAQKNIIFLATSVELKSSPYAIPLLLGNIFYKNKNLMSDGLVAYQDAGINRVDISIHGVDHGTTVLPAKQNAFSNYKASRACFRTLLAST